MNNSICDQNLEELYEKDNSKDLFVCKYSDCQHQTKDENQIRSHCEQHLTENIDEHQKTEEELESNCDQKTSDLTDESIGQKKIGKYVCDFFGCNKQFSYLKCFESHKRNEHLVNEKNVTKKVTNGTKDDNQRNGNDWELYVDCREIDGKEKLFCKWTDCHFGSNLRVVIKQHIINSHLIHKRIRSRPKIHNEYEYWDKILFDKKGIRLSSESKNSVSVKSSVPVKSPVTVKSPPPVKSPVSVKTTISIKSPVSVKNSVPVKSCSNNGNNLSKSVCSPKKQMNYKPKIESEILAKKHITIDKNKRDVLLSCKGLASMTKVSKYFVKNVINGEKIYVCKWNACQFRTKKSQKIAEHINLSHIGVEFKCNKPNCNKVFKNPHSYREHQKNHICGFGSFGYGSKGVIGVCRNENLFKYRERILIKGKKYYRCKICYAITKYFTGMKRHLHSQHICPFRMNLHLTRHQTPIAIKQEIMDMDIDLELFKNPFICCVKCNQFFDSEEDLRKHEIMFCRVKDNSIDEKSFSFDSIPQTNEDLGEKPQKNNSNNNKLKLSEQIRRNVNAINESIAKNLSLNNQLKRFESQNSIDKYIYVKNFEGIDHYLCNVCKFITKLKDTINDHILSTHLQNQNPNVRTLSTPPLEDYSQMPVLLANIKVEKSDYEENEELNDEDIRPSTSGVQTFQNESNIEKYVSIKSIDGEPNFFCSFNNCRYYTNDFIEIKTHLKESHVLYECDVENCGKQFKNQMVLNAHKVNHICGFGIKGRKPIGVCALDNIKNYRDERLVNDRLVYGCKWPDCRFQSDAKNILSHIHNKHVCVNRVLSNDNQKKANIGHKTQPNSPQMSSTTSVRHSTDDSNYDSTDSTSQHSSRRNDLEVLGTFGTQESLDNFAKYSEEVVIEGKTIFVCLYPNCLATPRNRLNSPKITERYQSYVTDFKHNMIRHIRRHCNDKPFVCGINGCEKRFSCSSQFKNHQSSH